MAQTGKTAKPEQKRDACKAENWGRPSGGTNYLIAGTGAVLNVPIKQAVLAGLAIFRLVEAMIEGFRYFFRVSNTLTVNTLHI
jgi:hypothetical protein